MCIEKLSVHNLKGLPNINIAIGQGQNLQCSFFMQNLIPSILYNWFMYVTIYCSLLIVIPQIFYGLEFNFSFVHGHALYGYICIPVPLMLYEIMCNYSTNEQGNGQ